MPLPIPNLDDRRWLDLVEDGRSLIPLYGPEWTDHNYHDPGVTLIELLAWIAEMDLYELNRVPERHKRKFLSLVGITPQPPHPARTVLRVEIEAHAQQPLKVPAGIIFSGVDPFGVTTPFRTLTPLTAVVGNLQAIQINSSGGFHDVTDQWRRGLPFGIFGDVPEIGSEVYLGFDTALPTGDETSLYLGWMGSHSDEGERQRLIDERLARLRDCAPAKPQCGKCSAGTLPAYRPHVTSADDLKEVGKRVPRHQGVRLEWKYFTQVYGSNTWRRLDPVYGEVNDDTRAFTLDGRVLLKPPTEMVKTQVEQVPDEFYYVRVRVAAGSYDAPPVLRALALNAVAVEQSVPVTELHWTIAANVVATGPEPKAGSAASFRVKFDSAGEISALDFLATEGNPQFFVLQYVPAQTSAVGALVVEGGLLPAGTGLPTQQGDLSQVPVDESGFELWTLDADHGIWYRWTQRADFDSSGRSDRHFLLDATTGTITFGDGNHGLVLPRGERPFAIYRSTRAEAGNLYAESMTLTDSLHNRAVSPDFDKLLAGLGQIDSIVDATGGAAAESLAHAIGRAVEGREAVARAVNAGDFEWLAIRTPGAQIARAKAWPNLHASFPCLSAPGMVSVVILPAMPIARPVPSPGTLRLVAAYLNRRRIIGTRVLVVGPTYREVAVRCQVKAFPGASKTTVQRRVADALNLFLSPLQGGPDGDGWPFGRDVFRSEILKVVDQVPGVDHVLQLSLLVDGCECNPQCGNVCLAPTELVDAGQHEIEVI